MEDLTQPEQTVAQPIIEWGVRWGWVEGCLTGEGLKKHNFFLSYSFNFKGKMS